MAWRMMRCPYSPPVDGLNHGGLLFIKLTANNSGETIMNKVICIGSSQIKTVLCGDSEIIDIQSVTIASVGNRNQCTEEYMIPVIESIQPPCKRSVKNNRHTDGSEVYKRYRSIVIIFAHFLYAIFVSFVKVVFSRGF